MAAEDRRNRNRRTREALAPLDRRHRMDRDAQAGLAPIGPDRAGVDRGA